VILERTEEFSVIFFVYGIFLEELPDIQVAQQEALTRLLIEKGYLPRRSF
jgi:hypothetical protein